jgi:hypothetical protein
MQARLSLLFGFAIVVIVIITAALATYVWQSDQQEADILNTPQNIDQAYWSINKVEPNPEGDKVGYTVSVMSSIGNIRRYSNVQSYGLSNDRRYIALSVASNLDIVDLGTDIHTKVNMPFAYSGDFGDVVTWSAQDKYIALAVMKDQNPDDTHLLVFTNKGDLVKDVSGKFTYGMEAGANKVFPARFAPGSELILTRTYKSDDLAVYSASSKPYTVEQLPAYLSIYNVQGEKRAEYPVRDADNTGTKVIYTWNMDGSAIKYAVVRGNKEINYADNYLFTTQLVNLPSN